MYDRDRSRPTTPSAEGYLGPKELRDTARSPIATAGDDEDDDDDEEHIDIQKRKTVPTVVTKENSKVQFCQQTVVFCLCDILIKLLIQLCSSVENDILYYLI